MFSTRSAAAAAVACLAVAMLLAGAVAADEARSSSAASSRDRLHVKFVDGSAIRLRGNTLVSVGTTDVSELRAVLRRYPGVKIQRLFSRSEGELTQEKARNERRTGRKQPDKNLWYRMVLPASRDAGALIADLNALEIVQTAYREPLPSPAPVTPSFVDDQGYLNAATDGIDAEYAWTIPGGTGGDVRIIDIEYEWNQNHEDLDAASGGGVLIPNGTPDGPFDNNDHGTAVLGELIATNDSIGVTGIAHDADIGLVNANNTEDGYDLADSIDLAAANLVAGDVMLIEQQTAGANGGCGDDQVGCVAVEWVEAYYDAIVSATSAGIIVVEAAGNGNENLGDTGDYGDPFPDGRADSGAIIVGAGGAPGCTSPARGRLDFSTFGPRVNLQGWGQCVVTTGYGDEHGSSQSNDAYTDSFGGTSSASPIVSGAAAILSSVAQQQGVSWTPQQVRARLVATGTAQQFGLSGNIGPLPNLREALRAFVPDSNAGGPYATPEGTNVTLDGGASTDPNGDTLTYAWDFDNDGFDDGATQTVAYDRVGQDGSFTVRLRVTDEHGASDIDTATVNVTNVAPTTVVDPTPSPQEGSPVTITATVTDPGWLEDLDLSVDWGDGSPVSTGFTTSTDNTRPNAVYTFSASHTYGDDGVFPLSVCGHDDDTQTCVPASVTVTNVAPTVVIDETDTTLVNGVPTFIAHEGVPLDFKGRATDPGSDDLTVTWSWGDGPPVPDESSVYLNDGPGADPDPSPTINPRDVTDMKSHVFGEACFYTIVLDSLDDDSGNAVDDTGNVIIAGNAAEERGAGYWQTQYRPRPTAFSEARRTCYLAIARFMSAVFDESRNASTVPLAFDVLDVGGNGGEAFQKLDRELLAAWLNFANGAFDLGELVDTNGDSVPDTTFGAMMAAAEAVRNNPFATEVQMLAQRDILQLVNGA
jgi:serine protease